MRGAIEKAVEGAVRAWEAELTMGLMFQCSQGVSQAFVQHIVDEVQLAITEAEAQRDRRN